MSRGASLGRRQRMKCKCIAPSLLIKEASSALCFLLTSDTRRDRSLNPI